jgi:hypothetical protein
VGLQSVFCDNLVDFGEREEGEDSEVLACVIVYGADKILTVSNQWRKRIGTFRGKGGLRGGGGGGGGTW